MTELEKAAQQALEALEKYCTPYRNGTHPADEVITALRRALEQPAQHDCCANCLRPEREHKEDRCPKPYTTVWHAWDYEFPPEQPAQQEPFGHVTVRRLSQRFENHADQHHFYPAGQSPYLDNVDELYAVYTRPQAREPLTGEQLEHGCHRSHPHEDMDAMCELRTEIARLTNENARIKAKQQKPLTDREIITAANTMVFTNLNARIHYLAFARAIEAAHGIGEKK